MTHFDMTKNVFSCLMLQCGAPDLPGKLGAVLPQRKGGIVPEQVQSCVASELMKLL